MGREKGGSMKRLVLIVALAAALGVAFPASSDTVNNSCSAQQAATVAALIQDTAPTCTFEITCTGVSLGCIYVVTLDANGTLLG